jgi:hypothetical protein
MTDEFKAKIVEGVLVIEPIIVKKEEGVVVKLPALSLLNKFTQEVNNK